MRLQKRTLRAYTQDIQNTHKSQLQAMYALMSDFKMLCCHVSLVPRLDPETTGHVNKAKLQQSLLMDVDLPLGTEQALMLHSVYIIPCILLS